MGLSDDENAILSEVVDFDSENNIVRSIQKEKFYKFLEDNKFDVRLLTYTDRVRKRTKTKFENKDFDLFNRLLLLAKEKCHIKIKESILFLEEDYNVMNTILSFLNTENKLILRKELISDHNLDRGDTDLGLYVRW